MSVRHAVIGIAHHNATAHLFALSGLLLAAYLTVQRSFFEFGFYYDDWRFVQLSQQAGSVPAIFPLRPLHQPLTDLVFSFVGIHPLYGYIMLAVMLVASTLAMHWVVNALFPRRRGFAVLATALFLLYPGDLSRTWMSAGLTANRPAVLLALLSLGLLFTALRKRHRRRKVSAALFVASIMLYVASLLLYEAQSLLVPGLGFAGALWIEWTGRGLAHRNARRKALARAALVVAPYIAVLGGVVAWRVLLIQSGSEDRLVATADFSAGYLARELAGVYYFNFIAQPFDVAKEGLPAITRPGLVTLGLAVLATVLAALPVLMLTSRLSCPADDKVSRMRLAGDIRFYDRLFICGLLLTAVVYAVILPHDHIISSSGLERPFVSRLNTAAAVAVALTGAAAAMLVWTWARRKYMEQRWRVNVSAVAAIAAVFTVLIAYHAVVQSDYAEAWDLQQRYTRQIVENVPDVEPETHFVISGVPSRYGSSYVYMDSVENMLRLVYGDPTISATAVNSGFTGWRLNGDGLYRGDELIAPAGHIVFLQLETAGCSAHAAPGCGSLVLSDGIGADMLASGNLGPDAALVVTNYSRIHPGGRAPSLVDSLLGLPAGTAAVASTGEEPDLAGPPQFFSPSEPPGE